MTEYIRAGESQLPVRISYRVLKKMETLDDKEGQYNQTEGLLFLALTEGHRREGIKFELTRESLEDLIDDYPDILGQFAEISKKQIGELVKKMTGVEMQMDGMPLSNKDLKPLDLTSTNSLPKSLETTKEA